jgi:hypothetical protein
MPDNLFTKIFLLLFLFIPVCVLAQDEKLPILNGAAAELPHPEYTLDLKRGCFKGEVRVKIEYKASGGNPLSAKLDSENDMLKQSVESAAMKAKLNPVRHADPRSVFKGILVYNFVDKPNILCIDTKKVLNDRVKKFPVKKVNPEMADGHLRLPEKEIEIEVAIVIDEIGKVVYAKVEKATPTALKSLAPVIARQAEFSPTNVNGGVRVRGYLVIRFASDGGITLPKITAQK